MLDIRLANGSGILAHTNMLAFGTVTGQPTRARPSQSTSRRFSYTFAWAATSASPLRRAMIAAI